MSQELKLKDIKFDKRNYRIHSQKNKDLIKKSVEECGLARSIVIDSQNEIIGGNGLVSSIPKNTKIKVIETKGDELVVVKRTDLKTNDEKRKKLAILDNSTSDTSEFNMDMLTEDNTPEELAELGIEIETTDVPVEQIEEDDIPEEVQTRTQKGDLWKLGEHYLLCGDNGIFAGYPMPEIHKEALNICKRIYKKYEEDGKIVLNKDTNELTVCWAGVLESRLKELIPEATKINPLGYWTGGINVDTGVTGRKLASDFYGIEYPLGGGTIHGKDLSKADCSVNIYCFIKAQETNKEVKAICSIGDTEVNINGQMIPFKDIVAESKKYIEKLGGFEKLAEWGLR